MKVSRLRGGEMCVRYLERDTVSCADGATCPTVSPHFTGPPENTMQRCMTVHVTCQNHVGYMTFNISDMHFDMSEHFEHVVCHDSTCNLPCSTTNEDVFAP